MSKQWLVAVDWRSNITVYTLPDLQLRSWKQVSCHWHPRADTAGVIYLPYKGFVSMIEISDNGNVTVLGTLNAGDSFKRPRHPYEIHEMCLHYMRMGYNHKCWQDLLISVAIGPQPGQLYMAGRHSSNFYLVNATSDTIIHTLTLPDEINDVIAIAALNSGQILVATNYGKVALYPSVFEPAKLLTDVPHDWAWVSTTANANQFLITVWGASQLFLMDEKGSWDAVRALNGVDGVWLPTIEDVAVWEDCVWVCDFTSSLILLCLL